MCSPWKRSPDEVRLPSDSIKDSFILPALWNVMLVTRVLWISKLLTNSHPTNSCTLREIRDRFWISGSQRLRSWCFLSDKRCFLCSPPNFHRGSHRDPLLDFEQEKKQNIFQWMPRLDFVKTTFPVLRVQDKLSRSCVRAPWVWCNEKKIARRG